MLSTTHYVVVCKRNKRPKSIKNIMKTITIGDLHGRDDWKTIDPDKYDKIIFIGDYLDSFDISGEDMLNNLLDVIAFKKAYMDKVVLLVGNHTFNYLEPTMICSGYNAAMAKSYNIVLTENRELLQLSYQYGSILWTHAGVHREWWEKYKKDLDKTLKKRGLNLGDDYDIADTLNLGYSLGVSSIFDAGYKRGGINDVGGPLWIDKSQMVNKPLESVTQIVGHTHVDTVQTVGSVTFVDCVPEFYELEI